MTSDVEACLVCAWRANCAKRFNVGDGSTLHCPDFVRDVLLDIEPKDQAIDQETEEKQ